MNFRKTLTSLTLTAFLWCFIAPSNAFAQQQLFKTLEENIKSFYLMTDENYKELNEVIKDLEIDPNAVDQVTIEVYQKKAKDAAYVNKYLKLLNENGSWKDINYQDTKRSGWEPKIHAERILTLTTIYSNPKSEFYKNEKLKVTLHKALDFWFKAKLVCPNWWYNEIGLPKTLGPSFIFLKSELSAEEMKEAISVLNNSTFKQTGQNKVWQAGNILFKAILMEDEALAKRARDTIFSELKTTIEEGIQPDFSFHQHGPQQQFGNYGLSFITSMSFWARSLAGTNLKLEEERLSILRNLILNGFSWVNWKKSFDVNSIGRQFFKGTQQTKSLGLAYAVIDMMYIDQPNLAKYKSFISNNYKTSEISELTGTNHFWRSDMTVHRSEGWSSSVKISSNRIQASEALNNENLKGYHMGDGTTFLYVDGDEYDDIAPVWNWKKLPGVTNYQKPEPLPILTVNGYRNKGDFTGGISSNKNGITAFQLNRDFLTGNKAWFYFNDQLICLGAALTGNLPDSVTTSINQTFAKEKVMVFDKKLMEHENGELKSSTIKWMYHHKIGYFSLATSHLKVTKQVQKGSWEGIAAVYNDDKTISKDILTIEIEHGNKVKDENYAYVVLPNTSLNEMKTYEPDFEVLQNNKKVQAIISKDKNTAMFVVYKPSKIKVKGINNIDFKTAGLYLLQKNETGWELLAADPTQKQNLLELDFGKINHLIKLPIAEEKGKTISINLIKR